MIQRLDKFLCDAGIGTRKEIKALVSRGRVKVNGIICKSPDAKADYSVLCVELDGEAVEPMHNVVCVLNKPAGFVTSTDDPSSRTVMELVPEKYLNLGVVPVGRLDKDTEGVLLFTNDGELLHRLISPKSDIAKTYFARFEGTCPENVSELFAKGIILKDGSICKSAEFEKLSEKEFRLTITEGMYHQVKRMAAACGMHVTYLKRESFAGITLEGLESGQFKELEDFPLHVSEKDATSSY